MARRGKKLFDSYKRRGEWVELLFMTVASGLGFNVFRPWGDSGRYDVALEHEGRFLRVQVKSTEMWLGTCYLCQLYAYGQRAYTAKEIDYYAIYVLPADVLVYLSSQGAGGNAHDRCDAPSQRTQIRTLHGKLGPVDPPPLPPGKECGGKRRQPPKRNDPSDQADPEAPRRPGSLTDFVLKGLCSCGADTPVRCL